MSRRRGTVAWCGDITVVSTWAGPLYLASVIDLYSRRRIGWAIDDNCRAQLVCDALKMALATRGGRVAGVVMHTDQGSQYTSRASTGPCERHRKQSRSGSCRDNAAAEAFFATRITGDSRVA